MDEGPTILVTGGAGYVGSHAVLALLEAGFRAVVLDDLSTGDRALVPPGVPLIEGKAGDEALLGQLIGEHGIQSVLHFAGSIVVEDSVADPLAYYANNTGESRRLIAACVAGGVAHFIFSSTATVYGEPRTLPIPEDAPTRPVNPYAASKLMTERILSDASAASALRHASLRYFNVAGADPQGRSGQCGPRATHLIKIACELATGKGAEMPIFGTDYATPDGTARRDYIHVSDLADAHVAALRYLMAGGASVTLNCGYGRGISVLEVLAAVEAVAGVKLKTVPGPRRAGDVAELVADTTRLAATLDWRPKMAAIETIVATALEWERRLAGRET